MKLVDGWRESWKWLSVHVHALNILIIGILALSPTMPDEIQAAVPMKWRALALGVWAFLGLAARVVKQ